MEQNKKIKIAVVALAVLLVISLLALGAVLLYGSSESDKAATVTVPDNLITSEEEDTETASVISSDEDTRTASADPTGDNTEKTDEGTEGQKTEEPSENPPATETKQAVTIELYNKQSEENMPFEVGNMFPGDSETKYFRVQVSYHDSVTVHYRATVREGYEKLAEVMKVKVKLLTTGETMYDGLMRDMPASVTYDLSSAESTTAELYYEITAYLDTSVGNDYQNKDLAADFRWWVADTEKLDPSQSGSQSKTGDSMQTVLFASIAAASAVMIILLLIIRRRKEEKENG